MPADRDISEWSAAEIADAAHDHGRRVRGARVSELRLLLSAAASRGITLDTALLKAWISHQDLADPALAAAAVSGDPAIVGILRSLLGDPERCVGAVRALGRQRDTASGHRILDLLPSISRDLDRNHVLVALEMLGDPSLVPRLMQLAPVIPAASIYYFLRAVRRLSGHSPLIVGASTEAYLAETRRLLGGIDPTVPPLPSVTWTSRGERDVGAEVSNGTDVFALEDDDSGPTSSWPSWFTTWTEHGHCLYIVGSGCDTCEVFLNRTGWAPAHAVELAQTIRHAVSDVDALTPALLDALLPVIAACATGRYELRLRDTRLEVTSNWSETWVASHDRRDDDEDDDRDRGSPGDDQIGYSLYTARTATGEPDPLLVAPTQPAEALDEARVRHYEEAIGRGERPAALVAAHAAQRFVVMSEDRLDRSVTGFIVDGHHKLAAYDRLGIPARVIWLCDLTPRLNPGTSEIDGIYAEFLG